MSMYVRTYSSRIYDDHRRRPTRALTIDGHDRRQYLSRRREMSEIITKWLQSQLGIQIDTQPDLFGNTVRDGYLVGLLLYNYAVITSDQLKTLKSTNDTSECVNNLGKLSVWLQKLGIHCSQVFIEDMAAGKSVTALRLFYQLYLTLEDKYKLRPIKIVEVTEHRPERVERSQRKGLNKVLAEPIVAHKEILDWYKMKYETNKTNLERTREKYKRSQAKKIEELKRSVRKPSVKRTADKHRDEYRKFKAQAETYEKNLKVQDGEKVCCDLDRLDDDEPDEGFVKTLVKKKNKYVYQHNVKEQIQKVLFNELCAEIIGKQERELDEIIATKLLNQSEYEKQIATKLLEVRHQKDVIVSNKAMIDNLINERQLQEFNRSFMSQHRDVDSIHSKIDVEQKRVFELHARLYAEKLRRRAARHFDECFKISEAFVDFASKISDYRTYFETPVPDVVFRQWRTLYFAGMRLYDDSAKEDSPAEECIEDIHRCLDEREQILNEQDFYEYLTMNGQWSCELLPAEPVIIESMEDHLRGENVLGYVVHRLLSMKYPLAFRPEPPDLPPFIVSACVLGLEDPNYLPIIQDLLAHRGITIVEIQYAINYCLEAYKEETILINARIEERQKLGKQNSSLVVETSAPYSERNSASCTGEEEQEEEEEEDRLSPAGIIGQKVDEFLSDGESIPDKIIVEALVEYLKSLVSSNGWVLFDFPTKISQAVLLEYKITSNVIPRELLKVPSTTTIGYSETSVALVDPTEDIHIESRKSALLPNPCPPKDPHYYDTFLTAFIKMKHLSPDAEDLTEESSQIEASLDDFYTDQGVFCPLAYDRLDFDTIKRLVKQIIGDFTLPAKSSQELMGEDLAVIEQTFAKWKSGPGGKKIDAKQNKRKSMDLRSKISASANVSLGEIQECLEHVEEEYVFEEMPEIVYVPGDPGYQYVNLPQPLELIKGLPTFWENIEMVYLKDIKVFFFMKRFCWMPVMPYVSYVRDHMRAYVHRPDFKQDRVYAFQKEYNDLEQDLRGDVEVKAEFHCRLAAMRAALWEICDERMLAAETERQRIIDERWILDQMTLLANLFISVMQLELDRCADTMQLLQDYYGTMLGNELEQPGRYKKPALVGVKSKIDPAELPKEVEEKKKGVGPSKSKKQSITMGIVQNINLILNKNLTNPTLPFNFQQTHFNQVIADNYHIAMTEIEQWNKAVYQMMEAEKSGADPKKKKPNKAARTLTPSLMEAIFMESEKLVDEWSYAVNYELKRATVRIEILQTKVLEELVAMYRCAERVFHDTYKDIAHRYEKEVKSVAQICFVLARAIEAEVKLQPQLAIVGDDFVVIEKELLYLLDERLIPPEAEQISDEFTNDQLEMLCKIFMYVAPSGSILQKSFIYILEDLIAIDTEHSVKKILPPLWRQVQTVDVTKIVVDIYGATEYVDWRNFIVANMKIPYPTDLEILKVLRKLRSCDLDKTEHVPYEEFRNIRCWFEKRSKDSIDDPKTEAVKIIIYNMYRTEDRTAMNYTSFLLNFCKDYDPLMGLVKGISIAVQSLICWNVPEGEKFIAEIKRREYEKERAVSFSNMLCKDLVESALNESDGVVITEIESESKCSSSRRASAEPRRSSEGQSYEYNDYDDMYDEFGEYDEEMSLFSETIPSTDSAYSILAGEKAYYLTFQTVFAVLLLCMPWHMRLDHSCRKRLRQNLESVFADLMLFDRRVFVHELLQHPIIRDIVLRDSTFKIVDYSYTLSKYVQHNIYKSCLL